MALLWSGKIKHTITEIYDGEYRRTLRYIADNYFQNTPASPQAFHNAVELLKKRLDMSARHISKKIETKAYTGWYSTPFNYFSMKNKNGFAGTKSWLMRGMAKKKESETRMREIAALNQAVGKVRKTENDNARFCFKTMESQLRYIQRNHPDMVPEFCKELNLEFINN